MAGSHHKAGKGEGEEEEEEEEQKEHYTSEEGRNIGVTSLLEFRLLCSVHLPRFLVVSAYQNPMTHYV